MRGRSALRSPSSPRIRGYIVRALAKGNQNSLLVRQVTNALLADNLITVPDISKQISYLEDGGYIEFTDKRATAYNAYRRDAVIQLTKAGVDLVEGTRERPRRRCLRANAGGRESARRSTSSRTTSRRSSTSGSRTRPTPTKTLSAWLKAEGYEISKSAIGRYAIRSTQAAQRVAET